MGLGLPVQCICTVSCSLHCVYTYVHLLYLKTTITITLFAEDHIILNKVLQSEPDKDLMQRRIAPKMFLKWSEFGLALSVPYDEIKEIQTHLGSTSIRYKGICDVIEYWSKHTVDPKIRTWDVILKALGKIDEPVLVETVKQELCEMYRANALSEL